MQKNNSKFSETTLGLTDALDLMRFENAVIKLQKENMKKEGNVNNSNIYGQSQRIVIVSNKEQNASKQLHAMFEEISQNVNDFQTQISGF